MLNNNNNNNNNKKKKKKKKKNVPFFLGLYKEQTTITRVGRSIYIYEFMWSKGCVNSTFTMRVFYEQRYMVFLLGLL